MFQFLAKPYPREQRDPRRGLLTSAGAGAFVSIFLLVFQPFGAAQWNDPAKPYILAGYGLVTFVCLEGVGLFSRVLFKKWFAEYHWNVGKEIGWNMFIIVFIAFGNMLYSNWALGGGFGWLSVSVWVGITAAIGAIPTTVIILLTHNRLLRKYAAADLHIRPAAPAPQQLPRLTFTAENERDSLTVAVNDLLFIESADNYSEIVFLQDGKIKKTLLRGSLGRFEEQACHPDVVRCHRSYIVNLQLVESISGNAQGYRLQLKNYPSPLPVARRYGDLVAGYFRK